MTPYRSRWLDTTGKPIEDHPELPIEHQAKQILKRSLGMPLAKMLISKIVRETLKAKGYDLDEMETVNVTVGADLRKLLERQADDKPVVSESVKTDRSHHVDLRGGET